MTTVRPWSELFGAPDRLEIDPEFARLREERPLQRVRLTYGEPAWLATRYEDAKLVLSDPRFSRAAATGRDEPRTRMYSGSSASLLSYDPPEHGRLRRLVAKAFTARRVERLRPRTQRIADDLVDRMVAAGPPAELVEDFALPLPITVICELLGVPVADRRDFRLWSDAFLSTTRFTPEQVTEYTGRLWDYMAGLIDDHRRTPRDDLIGALIAARDEQDRLSEDELLAMAVGILVAGHETTASQIPNFVYTLLTHPAQLAAVRADPGLIPQAVEELMRFVPLGGGAGSARYALEDVEVGGVKVRSGEPVVVAVHSANRDESVYTDPDTLDLNRHRQEPAHIGFGHGPHHCLGAQLARMELQVALGTLLGRLPGLRFAGSEEDIVWKTGTATRGPERLPLTWDEPRPRSSATGWAAEPAAEPATETSAGTSAESHAGTSAQSHAGRPAGTSAGTPAESHAGTSVERSPA
ncbi:cytochrome P450 [Actinomadura viridis]|uniref:Cytochrome P450 n=1 Tax=Actinomadura viridis TaxID=58110 RepID=A0A931DQQ0_9ACTN|nr:cytochrome P450 [Actinomadura viridis]MBG6092051.1 cytochrome P450 [Actinomadura viridis]